MARGLDVLMRGDCCELRSLILGRWRSGSGVLSTLSESEAMASSLVEVWSCWLLTSAHSPSLRSSRALD